MLITKDTWLGLTFFLIGLLGFLNYLSVMGFGVVLALGQMGVLISLEYLR